MPEAYGSGLMSSASDWDIFTKIERTVHQLIMTSDIPEHSLQLCGQALMSFQVSFLDTQHDWSIRLDRDAVVGIGYAPNITLVTSANPVVTLALFPAIKDRLKLALIV